jgi:alkylhydroperoxidase/carboxymuconolactone decarboxylase family protein YurZ
MLGAALTVGVTPVEVKEVVYQAVPYVGLAKVFDFLHVTNEVLTDRGVELPLPSQSSSTLQTRADVGLAVQKQIVGAEKVDGMYGSATEDVAHIQKYLTANCFGDYVARSGLDLRTRETADLLDAGRARRRRCSGEGSCLRQSQRRERPCDTVGGADSAAAVHRIPPHSQRPECSQRDRSTRGTMTMAQRTWLITGVSSGFGRQLTEQLLDRGDRVVGTVRRPDSVTDLGEKYPDLLRIEVLDVRETAALRGVVQRTVADLGRIDVVISNAGYGVFGAAEEPSDEQECRREAVDQGAQQRHQAAADRETADAVPQKHQQPDSTGTSTCPPASGRGSSSG